MWITKQHHTGMLGHRGFKRIEIDIVADCIAMIRWHELCVLDHAGTLFGRMENRRINWRLQYYVLVACSECPRSDIHAGYHARVIYDLFGRNNPSIALEQTRTNG